MNENKREMSLRIVPLVTGDIEEEGLDITSDIGRINEIIKIRIADFQEIHNMINRLSRYVGSKKKVDPRFYDEFEEFFMSLTKERKRVFFSLAIEIQETATLREFLEKFGVIISADCIDDQFETVVVLIPEPRLYPGPSEPEYQDAFPYIKIGGKVFDFEYTLYEELAGDLVCRGNIGGTDEPLE